MGKREGGGGSEIEEPASTTMRRSRVQRQEANVKREKSRGSPAPQREIVVVDKAAAKEERGGAGAISKTRRSKPATLCYDTTERHTAKTQRKRVDIRQPGEGRESKIKGTAHLSMREVERSRERVREVERERSRERSREREKQKQTETTCFSLIPFRSKIVKSKLTDRKSFLADPIESKDEVTEGEE
jgi:hypothetical protein